MSNVEAGFNSFVKHCKANDASYVEFGQGRRFHLRSGFVAAPSYVVGPGTACLAASRGASAAVELDTVVKFSWRDDAATHAELRLLELARKRNVKGVVRILGSLDLVSISELRHGLQFRQPFASRTLSCAVTVPLGQPFQKFQSIPELLDIMGDLVEALRSLYLDSGIIHRDVAIKNLVIAPQSGADRAKGMLIDLFLAWMLTPARRLSP